MGGLCQTEARSFYVWVRFERLLTSVKEAQLATEEIEAAMRKADKKKILFDMRGIGSHQGDVRDFMWDWADASPDLIAFAILLDDEMAQVRTNMTGVSREVRVKAFGRTSQAESWLASAEVRKKTRESPRAE